MLSGHSVDDRSSVCREELSNVPLVGLPVCLSGAVSDAVSASVHDLSGSVPVCLSGALSGSVPDCLSGAVPDSVPRGVSAAAMPIAGMPDAEQCLRNRHCPAGSAE